MTNGNEKIFDQAMNQAADMTRMWSDFAAKMASSGMQFTPGQTPPDAARATRDAMLGAMSQQAEQFMRSPMFLQMMKESMSAAITLRKQMNEFLTRVQHEFQGAAREDVTSILENLRHLEHRVLDRIEDLEQRLDSMEERLEAAGKSAAQSAAQTAAKSAAESATRKTAKKTTRKKSAKKKTTSKKSTSKKSTKKK